MDLTISGIEQLAKLSALRLTDAEKEAYRQALSAKIAEFDALTGVDTSGVEITYPKILEVSDLRPDAIVPSTEREKLLRGAPEQAEGAYLVPGVIE